MLHKHRPKKLLHKNLQKRGKIIFSSPNNFPPYSYANCIGRSTILRYLINHTSAETYQMHEELQEKLRNVLEYYTDEAEPHETIRRLQRERSVETLQAEHLYEAKVAGPYALD